MTMQASYDLSNNQRNEQVIFDLACVLYETLTPTREEKPTVPLPDVSNDYRKEGKEEGLYSTKYSFE